MSDYKMNQYDLQSYFKSLCNSFYIAYEQVKRLGKELDILRHAYNEREYYNKEELEKNKERLEIEEQEYKVKSKELGKVLRIWLDRISKMYQEIVSTISIIRNNKFSIIITTKEEIYALMCFYSRWCQPVTEYPIVNMEEEFRQVFPTGEKVYEDFRYAYEEDMKSGSNDFMAMIYKHYV